MSRKYARAMRFELRNFNSNLTRIFMVVNYNANQIKLVGLRRLSFLCPRDHNTYCTYAIAMEYSDHAYGSTIVQVLSVFFAEWHTGSKPSSSPFKFLTWWHHIVLEHERNIHISSNLELGINRVELCLCISCVLHVLLWLHQYSIVYMDAIN